MTMQTRIIHVPLLEADWTPRPPSRRLRFRLRVRLAPRAGGLVLRRDARAGLVGVRPRRGAVENRLRGRWRGRRGLRPKRLRRPLVPDLLARLAMPSIAPIDSLTIRRAVRCGSATLTCSGILVPANRADIQRKLCTGLLRLEIALFRKQSRVHGVDLHSLGDRRRTDRRSRVLSRRLPARTPYGRASYEGHFPVRSGR